MRTAAALLVSAVLAACSQSQADAPAPRPATPQRDAAADAAIARGVVASRYRVGDHEMVMVEVPAKDRATRLPVMQRCYVWRDAEYRSATLACPGDGESFDLSAATAQH